MPLMSGHSKSAVKANAKELMHSYMKTGMIGTSRPASRHAAAKQAVAIALKKAGRSRKK